MLSVRAIKRARQTVPLSSRLHAVDHSPNDIRPAAVPYTLHPPQKHPHDCSEVRGPRPLVALPAQRVRAFYAHVPAGHSLWMWSASTVNGLTPLPSPPPSFSIPPAPPQHFVLITKSLSERMGERTYETRWGKLNQLALPTQHISQSIAGLLRDQRFFYTNIVGYKKYTYTEMHIYNKLFTRMYEKSERARVAGDCGRFCFT